MKHTLLYIAIGIALLSACTDEYKYTPGHWDNDGIFILADKTTYILSESDTQELTFSVRRHDTSQDRTYRIACDDPEFAVPTTVTLNAGEDKKDITVPFNVMVGTSNRQIKIYIPAEEKTYTYGPKSQTLTLFRCHPIDGSFKSSIDDYTYNISLKYLDMGTFTDDFGTRYKKYQAVHPYDDDHSLIFSVDENGKAHMDEQDAMWDENEEQGYKYLYTMKGKGIYQEKDNMIKFEITLGFPEMDLAQPLTEYYYFPAGTDPRPARPTDE